MYSAQRENVIQDYIDAYNHFDVKNMITYFGEDIKFTNIADGVTTTELTGLDSFRKQAESAKYLFSKRTLIIKSFKHRDNETELEVAFHAILATGLPNGLKKGDELSLQGKSIFKFSDNHIISLTDIS